MLFYGVFSDARARVLFSEIDKRSSTDELDALDKIAKRCNKNSRNHIRRDKQQQSMLSGGNVYYFNTRVERPGVLFARLHSYLYARTYNHFHIHTQRIYTHHATGGVRELNAFEVDKLNLSCWLYEAIITLSCKGTKYNASALFVASQWLRVYVRQQRMNPVRTIRSRQFKIFEWGNRITMTVNEYGKMAIFGLMASGLERLIAIYS